MGVNINQIATYYNALSLIGAIEPYPSSYIPDRSKAVTYSALASEPLSNYFSGGSSTNYKAVKYSALSLLTTSKSVKLHVQISNLDNAKYWGTKNSNASHTNYVYIKDYNLNIIATVTLNAGVRKFMSTYFTVPYNANGYYISYNIIAGFSDIITHTASLSSGCSCTVQPHVKLTVSDLNGNGLTFVSRESTASPYNQGNIANGATLTLGNWGLSTNNFIKVLPKSDTIKIDLNIYSIVSVDGGTYAGDSYSGSAAAVSVIGEWD